VHEAIVISPMRTKAWNACMNIHLNIWSRDLSVYILTKTSRMLESMSCFKGRLKSTVGDTFCILVRHFLIKKLVDISWYPDNWLMKFRPENVKRIMLWLRPDVWWCAKNIALFASWEEGLVDVENIFFKNICIVPWIYCTLILNAVWRAPSPGGLVCCSAPASGWGCELPGSVINIISQL
jgi:hypothetical protein